MYDKGDCPGTGPSGINFMMRRTLPKYSVYKRRGGLSGIVFSTKVVINGLIWWDSSM